MLKVLAALGGRALGFFGGGFAGYVGVGAVAALGLTAFALWWVNDDLSVANQSLGAANQAVAERDEAIKAQNRTIDAYKNDLESQAARHGRELALVSQTYERKLEVALAARSTADRITEVINENPEAKSWADTLVPAAILDCLRRDPVPTCAGSEGPAP